MANECRCYTAHGVYHLCDLCATTRVYRPTDSPYVPASRCRACICDRISYLEAQLQAERASLRLAELAVDPATGERVPPMFLTAKGWTR